MKILGPWMVLFLAGCEDFNFDLAHFTWKDHEETYQEEVNNDQQELARLTLRNAMLKRTMSESTTTSGYSK